MVSTILYPIATTESLVIVCFVVIHHSLAVMAIKQKLIMRLALSRNFPAINKQKKKNEFTFIESHPLPPTLKIQNYFGRGALSNTSIQSSAVLVVSRPTLWSSLK